MQNIFQKEEADRRSRLELFEKLNQRKEKMGETQFFERQAQKFPSGRTSYIFIVG
jgi:hypothetical protein